MGKTMSILASTALRPFRDYNIEQRAHKIVSQSKPKPAPKYESDKQALERIVKEHPEFLEASFKKDQDLDDRLRDVFVTTSHVLDQKRQLNPDRPLPVSTEHVGFFELGFKETEIDQIPPGKCSLRQAVQFIENYKMNPEEWTKEKIASEYKLKLEDVANVLEHFTLFAINIPKKGEDKKRILLTNSYDSQNFDNLVKRLKETTGQQNVSLADLWNKKKIPQKNEETQTK